MTDGELFACILVRQARLAGERLSPNRVRWIERLPPYDTTEFDALSSAPPLAQESVARNTEGRMNTTDRQVSGFIKRHHAPPAPPQPVRRGSYADHRLQFPELYVTPTPAPTAILFCLVAVLDHPDTLASITLVAETRGCGIGTVACELATKMALAGIGA